jgi:hypothetical protein
MLKLIPVIALLISFNIYAQFSAGQVIEPDQINDEFLKVKTKLDNRGNYIFNFEELEADKQIKSSTLNENFNNFLTIQIIPLNSFSPAQAVQASKMNENFNLMHQTISTQLSQRPCSVVGNIGSGVENFSDDDNSWGSCLASSCISGYHVESQTCLPDIRTCSVQDGSGTQNWISGLTYSSCVATSCIGAFHVESNQCMPNTRSCTTALITSGTQTWNQSITNYDSCTPSQCVADYHIENNQCVSNFETCTVTNGTGIATWNGSAYINCIATACTGSNHVESNICMANTKACTVPEGSGTQTWNQNITNYDACAVDTCNQYYQVASDGLSCQLSASQLNSKFSELARYKLISSNVRTTAVPVAGSTQVNSTIFSLTGLDTAKKYRVVSPSFLRIATAASTYTALVVDNKQVLYFAPPGVGEVSSKLDYTFTPTVSNPTIAVNSRSNGGIYLDNNGEIRIDVYEVVNNPPQTLTQGSATLAQLDQNFSDLDIKDELIQTIGTAETTVTVSSGTPVTSIGTISSLIIGQKYRIESSSIAFRSSSCAANPAISLKLAGQQIALYQTPTDGWYTNDLDVEFTASATSMALTLEKGSTNCTSHSMSYYPISIYKKRTGSSLATLAGLSSNVSQSIASNFALVNKKDTFIQTYSRSSHLIPTTGSTYVTATLFTLTGLQIGQKYKIKTPLYLQFRSSSGSAATNLLLDGNAIKTFYSNLASSILFMQFEHEFTATATSMPLTVSSRVNGGLYLDADNQIKLDLYRSEN